MQEKSKPKRARGSGDGSLAASYKAPRISLGQRQLARATAEFGGVPGMTRQRLSALAGFKSYSPRAFDAPGYKAALADYGLTEDLVATALVDDITNKPGKRYQELTLAADILGMRKQGSQVDNSKNLILMISGQTAQRYGAITENKDPVEENPNAPKEPGGNNTN